jgi:hypothetical protein
VGLTLALVDLGAAPQLAADVTALARGVTAVLSGGSGNGARRRSERAPARPRLLRRVAAAPLAPASPRAGGQRPLLWAPPSAADGPTLLPLPRATPPPRSTARRRAAAPAPPATAATGLALLQQRIRLGTIAGAEENADLGALLARMAGIFTRSKSMGVLGLVSAAQASYAAAVVYSLRDAELADVRLRARRGRGGRRWAAACGARVLGDGGEGGRGGRARGVQALAIWDPGCRGPGARGSVQALPKTTLARRTPTRTRTHRPGARSHALAPSPAALSSPAPLVRRGTYRRQGTGVSVYFPPTRSAYDPWYGRVATGAFPGPLADWDRMLGALYGLGDALASGATGGALLSPGLGCLACWGERAASGGCPQWATLNPRFPAFKHSPKKLSCPKTTNRTLPRRPLQAGTLPS